MYRTASQAAARTGQRYVLDLGRLERMFSRKQIDGILIEIDRIENAEREIDERLVALDALAFVSDDSVISQDKSGGNP